MTTKKRAVVYGRVSTHKEEQEQSLDIQSIGLKNKAINLGYKVVAEYAEKGSATSIRARKKFIEMIESCGLKFNRIQEATDNFLELKDIEPKYDVIFVKEPSRISRHAKQAMELVEQLAKKGVDIYFETSDKFASTMDKMFLNLLFSIAEKESQSTSDRIKYSKRTLSKEKKFRPSAPIYGYYKQYTEGSIKDYKVVVNENERPIVERIFDLYINHDYGTIKIANLLNSEGIEAIGKQRANSKVRGWSDDKVSRIISNPIYYGTPINHNRTKIDVTQKYYTKKGAEPIPLDDAVEPIISKETFDKAQEIKAQRTSVAKGKQRHGINRPKDNTYKGKLYCLHCGSRYVKKSNFEDISSYACSDKNKYGANHCSSSMIRITQLDKYIESSPIHLDYSTFDWDFDRICSELERVKQQLKSIIQTKKNEIIKTEAEAKRLQNTIIALINDSESQELVASIRNDYNQSKDLVRATQADIDKVNIEAIDELTEKVKAKYNALCLLRDTDKDEFTLTERIELLDKIEIGKRGLKITYNTPSFYDEVRKFNAMFEGIGIQIEWYDSKKERLNYYYYRHKGKECITLEEHLNESASNHLNLDVGLQKLYDELYEQHRNELAFDFEIAQSYELALLSDR